MSGKDKVIKYIPGFRVSHMQEWRTGEHLICRGKNERKTKLGVLRYGYRELSTDFLDHIWRAAVLLSTIIDLVKHDAQFVSQPCGVGRKYSYSNLGL